MEQTVVRIDKEEALGVAKSLRDYRDLVDAATSASPLPDAATHFLYRLQRLIAKHGWE